MTIFRTCHLATDHLKKTSLISAAVAAGFIQALPKAFDLPGTVAAIGSGELGGSWGDRLVALAARTGHWGFAEVARATVFSIPWILGFVVLFFLAGRAPARWKRLAFSIVWTAWIAAAAAGIWNGWNAWQTREETPRLVAPVDLVKTATGHSQRVFINPSALIPVAAVNSELIDSTSSPAELAELVQSPAKWRAGHRKNPFSAVLLAGNLTEAKPLIRHLLDSPDWYVARVDNQGILFLPASQPDKPDTEIPPLQSPQERATYLSQYAICLDAVGQKSAANERMEEALSISVNDFQILVRAASLAAFQGHWERAQTLAAKADKVRPDSFESQYLLAWSLLETRAFTKAFDLTSRLARSRPEDAAVLMLHARASRASKDFATETAALEQLLNLARNDSASTSRIHLFLGQSWAQRGFPNQALDHYKLALEGELSPTETRDIREAMKTIEKNRLKTGP